MSENSKTFPLYPVGFHLNPDGSLTVLASTGPLHGEEQTLFELNFSVYHDLQLLNHLVARALVMQMRLHAAKLEGDGT